MSQKTPQRKKKFIEAYKKNGFKVGVACDFAGVTPKTVRRWVEGDKDFAEEYENADERVLDEIESAILKRALGFTYMETKNSVKEDGDGNITEKTITETTKYVIPDVNAGIRLLDAHGRHRGYGMKQDDSDADQHVDNE